jgi:hypothetical protein
MIRTIVALIAIIASLGAGAIASMSVFVLLDHQHSAARIGGKIDAIFLFSLLSFYLLFVAIGLFRFRRWALIAMAVFAGLCSVYSWARILAMKPGASPVGSWVFLLGSVSIAVFLICVAPRSFVPPEIAGSRPLGVTVMAILGFVSLPMLVLTIFRDVQIQAPEWRVASAVFDALLCAALSFGLWKLKEWARVLTEVIGFLAPLAVLPLVLGTGNHKPRNITLVVTVLVYEAWTIWYLRKPHVEQAFM